MDRLAAEGTRFAQTTTVCPVCMPARASFVNGLYPHNHGMWFNRGQMPAEDETFFQILQGSGYYTAHVGKSHYHEHNAGEHLREREPYMHARGFDYVHETTGPYATCRTPSYLTDSWAGKGYWELFKQDYEERKELGGGMVRPSPLPVEAFPDSYVGRRAVEFVNGYSGDQPTCLFVGFGGPHDPWDAPGEYASMYDPADTPAAIPIPTEISSYPEWLRERVDFRHLGTDVLNQTAAIRANYYGKISLVDRWVGEILNAYAAKGLLDDLLVVFWSDHGEMAGDHGRIQKCTFHESSVRVPLIVRWPGHLPENAVSNELAEIIDVLPTVLEAAGCRNSHRNLGRSLLPVLRGSETELREYQLSEIDWQGRKLMIRSRTHKYAVDERGRGFMLYDLQNDPTEQNNLILDNGSKSLENKMRDALLKRLVEAQYTM
jgi:choline-sulfatase